MRRPLFFITICLAIICAIYQYKTDAPPFENLELEELVGHPIQIVGQIYKKEIIYRNEKEILNIYIKVKSYQANLKFEISPVYEELKIGNEIVVEGTFYSFSHATNPGEFDLQQYYMIQNIEGYLEQTRVLEINKKNNDEYLMLVGIDEDDELTDEIRYGKVVTMPDRKFGIQTIRDEDMVKELAAIFLRMFKDDYN